MKKIIYELFGRTKKETAARKAIDFFLMILIFANVIAVSLETVQSLYTHYAHVFRIFEIFSVAIFSIEYVCRIYTSNSTHPSKHRITSVFLYIFSWTGIIDLISILPFYLPMFVHLDLRFLRILRLTRFLRILKMSQFNKSLKLIYSVIREKKSELAVTCFFVLMILLIASFGMYYVESNAQPDKFSNVFMSFWWAIATLTTVGYGDIYPITDLGRAISGVIALLGIGLVALPTGIIGAGFMEKLGKKEKEAEIKITHVARWVSDLEASRLFYSKAFNALASAKYENESKGFSSYFMQFSEGPRLELMHSSQKPFTRTEDHFAVSVGSKQSVDNFTHKLKANGISIESAPRTTGDGYYESVILDPDGNRIEITI